MQRLFRFNDWPVGTKLMAAMTLLSLVSLAVVGGVTLYTYQIVASELTAMQEDIIPGALFMEATHGDVAGIIVETSALAETGDVVHREHLDELLVGAQESAAEHSEIAAHIGVEESQAAQEIEDAVGRVVTLSNQVIAAVQAGAASDDIASMILQMNDERHDLEPTLDEHLTEHLTELAAAEAAVESARRNATLATWVTILVAVPAAAGLAFGLSRLLTRQVEELRKVFRGVIVGNFEQRAAVLGQDELGEVADGMNAMLTLLTNLLAETGQLADQRLAILDATTDLVGIGGLDGRVLYMNPAGLAMGGYADVGDPTTLTIADFYSPEEGHRIATEVLPTVLERGIWSGEATLQRRDGTLIPTTHVVTRLTNDRGEPIGFANIARDITEQRQAEEALRQSEQLLRSVLDTTPDWIFVKDRDFRYVLANTSFASAIGTTPGQMIGKNDLEVGFPEELVFGDPGRGIHGFRTDDQAVLEQGKALHNPYDPATTAAGEELVFDTHKMPLHDDKGEVWAALGFARDVTNQQRVIADVEDAAAQVTGASASMTEIVQLLASQATSSAQTAEQATTSAAMGNQAVAQTVAAMNRIRDNTQETARRIKRLGETTQEISEAVRFIEELADRTTVLALNASIQAAAAGDAGRGFAVVAEEVQRLAERATGATRQIEELVKNIQAETGEAVIGIEDATREVVEGSHLAQEAGERMAELNATIGHLATLIEHVAETTAAQTGESVATLATLSQGLQESVAGFGTRGDDGDGHVN